jgi:hypothetical protein
MAAVVAVAAAACSVEAIQMTVHVCRWKAGGAQRWRKASHLEDARSVRRV